MAVQGADHYLHKNEQMHVETAKCPISYFLKGRYITEPTGVSALGIFYFSGRSAEGSWAQRGTEEHRGAQRSTEAGRAGQARKRERRLD